MKLPIQGQPPNKGHYSKTLFLSVNVQEEDNLSIKDKMLRSLIRRFFVRCIS